MIKVTPLFVQIFHLELSVLVRDLVLERQSSRSIRHAAVNIALVAPTQQAVAEAILLFVVVVFIAANKLPVDFETGIDPVGIVAHRGAGLRS